MAKINDGASSSGVTDSRMDRLESKLDAKFDSIEGRLDSIDKTLVKQEINLQEHMRRSDNLETIIDQHHGRITPLERDKIAQDAIRAHNGALIVKWSKIVGATVAIFGAIASLLTWAKPFMSWLLTL